MSLPRAHVPSDRRLLPLLIAEENSATRSALSELTSPWGYQALPVENGAQVLQRLRQERSPHIAILSDSLPDCGGIDLCRQIRHAGLAYYPYILLASHRNNKDDLLLASESGADDYIAKPFDGPVLRARLEVARRIQALQEKWVAADGELRARVARDELTGLWNRNSWRDLLARELDRAQTSGDQTGLLMLDLDRFKNVNDTYGHQAGDIVLQEAARRIQHSVRAYDFVGRYGGEEFCIVMPGCSDRQLRKRAEMIRSAVSSEPFRFGAACIPLTISLGATVIPPIEISLTAVLSKADIALYRGKASGRNVTVHCSRAVVDFAFEIESLSLHCEQCPAPHSSLCVVRSRASLASSRENGAALAPATPDSRRLHIIR